MSPFATIVSVLDTVVSLIPNLAGKRFTESGLLIFPEGFGKS